MSDNSQDIAAGPLRWVCDLTPLERMAWTAIAILILIAGPVSLCRVIFSLGGTDLPAFLDAGRHVLEHGTRDPDTILSRFLPSVDVVWILLSRLPNWLAAAIWFVFCVGTWIGLLAAVARYLLADLVPTDRRLAILGTAALTIVPVMDHLMLGAFHMLMLWLMLLGLGRIMQGKELYGSLCLGLAIWVKLLPILALPYLVLKRKWMAVVLSLAVTVLVDFGISTAGFGLRAAWTEHVHWWHTRAIGELDTILSGDSLSLPLIAHNQSPAAVMRRVLTQDFADHKLSVYRHSAIGRLSRDQVRLLYWSFVLVLAGAMAYRFRKPTTATDLPERSREIALLILATMWFSPLVWSYHATATIPATAVALARNPRRQRLVIVVQVTAMILLAVPLARSFGEYLWASLILGGIIAFAPAAAHQSGAASNARQSVLTSAAEHAGGGGRAESQV